MTEFAHSNQDYILFVFGLEFVLFAVVLLGLRVTVTSPLPWKWLGFSAAAGGASVWADMLGYSAGAEALMDMAHTLLYLVAALALLQFARCAWAASGGRRVSIWFSFGLVAAALAGSAGGWLGLHVGASYLLTLPAGLWAAAALIRYHRTGGNHGRPLLLTAAGMVLYAFAGLVLAPKAPLWPATTINEVWFLATFGFPPQIVGVLSAIPFLVGLWLYYRALLQQEHLELADRSGVFYQVGILVTLAVLIVGGFAATSIVGQRADHGARAGLTTRTAMVAAAINPERVRTLTGSPADLNLPDYVRLRQQLRLVAQASDDIRWLYLLTRRGNDIVFTVDGIAQGVPGHVDPGTRYREPPEGLARTFVTGERLTVGPHTDEYGTFITGYAPVRELFSGHVLGVLGLDVSASQWARALSAARLAPIIITMLLCLIALGFYVVSERLRLAAMTLGESEERSRLLLQAAGDGILGTDTQGYVRFMNAAAERVLGWTAEDLRLVRIHEAVHYAHADGTPYPIEDCPQRAAYAEGVERYVDDEVMWRRDGTSFPVEYIARPVLKHGVVTGGIVTFRDISARRAADEALRGAKEQTEMANRELEIAIRRANALAVDAEAASTAKSEFLANMSHEIRTPMNGVIGMTSLLLDTGLDQEQREYAETVQSSAEALLTIINDILDFSKIEAGKLAMETLDFDLRTAVEDTCDLPALAAHDKGLELIVSIAPDVPSSLRGDPGRLRQVLTNLIGNAIKFTAKGEVVISVQLDGETDASASLRFSVRDTGIGIPSGKLDMLFEAFTQADASMTRRFGGTGLGLTISKLLVELMGGEIGVESEEGSGSNFWFTAVFAKQASLIDGAADDGDHKAVEIAGVRVLAVDDNATNRQVIAAMLESWRCRHDEVDGAAAMEALRAGLSAGDPYRIVILDMMMPEVDGETLGRLIKEDPELNGSELVMMTSIGRRGDANRLERLGFVAYLTKPVKQSQLLDCLMAVLDRRERRSGVGEMHIVTRHALADRDKRRVRILLAEDNLVNQKVALKILEKMGYRADAVASGLEALAALERTPYDLVLMDVQMPEMDGLEATRRVRSAESAVLDHAVPIVALTAHAMAEDRDLCLAAGMNDYLSKPIQPERLTEAVKRWARPGGAPEPIIGGPRREGPSAPGDGAPGTASVGVVDDAASPLVFDDSVLLDLLAGDREAAAEIITEFLMDMPRQVEALGRALADGDVTTARRGAHSVKGASASVGAEALRAAASETERAAASGDLEAARRLEGRIAGELQRLLAEMPRGGGRG